MNGCCPWLLDSFLRGLQIHSSSWLTKAYSSWPKLLAVEPVNMLHHVHFIPWGCCHLVIFAYFLFWWISWPATTTMFATLVYNLLAATIKWIKVTVRSVRAFCSQPIRMSLWRWTQDILVSSWLQRHSAECLRLPDELVTVTDSKPWTKMTCRMSLWLSYLLIHPTNYWMN